MKNQIFLLIILIATSCNSKSKNQNDFIGNTKDKVVNNLQNENVINQAILKDATFVFDMNRSLKEYIENINKIAEFVKNAQVIEITYVESVIPLNDAEFGYFYSLSYPGNNLKLYNFLNLLIIEKALQDKGNCIKLFSNVAEFVDGEYADYFFEEIYTIAAKNAIKFCEIYLELSNRSMERLADIYNEICINNQY